MVQATSTKSAGGELETPLVQPTSKGGTATWLSTYLNMFKHVMGSYVGMPYAFASTGWFLGCWLAALTLATASLSIFFIVHTADTVRKSGGEAGSYKALAVAAWGQKAASRLDILISVYTCLVLISYARLLLEFGNASFALVSPELTKLQTLIPLTAVLLVPLCAMPRIDGLKGFSLSGNVSVVYACFLVCALWASGTLPDAPALEAVGGQPFRVMQGLSILVFVWNCHYNVPVYYEELSCRSPNRMMGIVACVYATAVLMHCCMTSGGYSLYGEDTKSNVIDNLPATGFISVDICRGALWATALVTYPIVCFGARGAISRSVLGTDEVETGRRWILAALLVVLPLLLASIVPNFGLVLALNSSLFGMMQQLIIPASLFLAVVVEGSSKHLWRPWRYAALLAIAAGIAYGVLGLIGTVGSFILGESK